MNNLEGERCWTEVPERREDWVLVEVGEETGERLNSVIDFLRTFGNRVVSSKGNEMRGQPYGPFLAKAFIGGEKDFCLSVSLSEWTDDLDISSVRVIGSGLPNTFPDSISVDLGWKGDKTIGLQEYDCLVDLVRSPRTSIEIRDWLRRLLAAEEVKVEVGRIVFPYPFDNYKVWRTLEEQTFSSVQIKDVDNKMEFWYSTNQL